MDRVKQHIGYGILTAALTVLSAGCSGDKAAEGPRGFEFAAEDGNRPNRQIFDTQAASGARADAMLYPHHFDGDKLNSLGTAKLDLMLRDDDACNPMTVYVNLATDDAHAKARHDAVTEYLKVKGLTDEQIALKDGPNPNSHSPAAAGLSNLVRTESAGSDVETAASGASSTAAK